GHSTENRELRLDEVLPLGADGRLYLVTVSGQRILLAAREGSIERINLDEATDEPTTVYRTIRQRPAAPPDEINISHSRLSTRPVRDDVITDSASWAERRDKLLRQLQDA
ncbi:MAG: flagellar biosynthetic protein FliO, partial [Armatimonadetes bacterium]|nr:flagellar biosynthetic protein FliO [Armatimonadota bacterium]